MPLRVTRNGMYDQVQTMLNRNTRKMVSLEEQLATLKRINRPSDDPLGAGRALRVRTSRDSYQRYLANIDRAQSDAESSTASLESIGQNISRIRSLALEAANPDVTQSARPAIASEIGSILNNIIADANRMHDGRYVFSGTATGTKPFETDTGLGGDISQVTYHGNMEATWVSVGPDARVQVNENGSDIFMASGPGEDIFSVIIDLRDTIANAAGIPDNQVGEAVSGKLGDIEGAHSEVLESLGRLAGRIKGLELRQNMFEDAEVGAVRALADLEDADITEVIFSLQNEQMQFEALLSSSAAMLRPTLMDFLR